jgi:suppressor of ftsI
MQPNRRDLLKFAAGSFAVPSVLSGCSGDSDTSAPARTVRKNTLTVGWLDKEFPGETGPIKVRLRAYNGQVPGPILETAAGEILEVTLENNLTAYDSSQWRGNFNVPHDLNTTNLHTHGLDTIPHLFEPLGTRDPAAMMIAVAPGESYHYSFPIPDDHPAGLLWYHPHAHGSTAVQAVSGLAGLLVVRGDVDEVPEIKAAREEFLVVSDLGLFPSDDEPDLWIYEPKQNAIWATFGAKVVTKDPTTGADTERPDLKGGFTTGAYALRYYAVNGVPVFRETPNAMNPSAPLGEALPEGVPTIAMRPGEVVRVRMLNGCSDLAIPLVLEGMPIHLFALDGTSFGELRSFVTKEPTADKGWDGTTTYEPKDATVLVLGPANRAEFLLKADKEGTFELVQAAHEGVQFLVAERKVLAKVVVAGEPLEMALPATLPLPDRYHPYITDSELVKTREFTFGSSFPAVANKEVGVDFTINGKAYDHHVVNTTVKRGTAETWTFIGHMHGGAEGHPFHLHENPLEVMTIGDRVQPPGVILDTIWISPNTTVETRVKFVEFVGKTVYHCHILPHEDTGMMHNLLIDE